MFGRPKKQTMYYVLCILEKDLMLNDIKLHQQPLLFTWHVHIIQPLHSRVYTCTCTYIEGNFKMQTN